LPPDSFQQLGRPRKGSILTQQTIIRGYIPYVIDIQFQQGLDVFLKEERHTSFLVGHDTVSVNPVNSQTAKLL
jgi:hypothetical protein